MIKVSDYVVRTLEEIGVTNIFTVSGGGSIFLCDAVMRSKKIKYIACHHEQAACIATEAYARQKRDLGVSLVTTGPGATNAITGVAGSWMDSVPHLTLSGQSFLSQTIGNSGLRQLGVQEINIVDLVRPITKYAVMIEDAKTIRYHLEKAIYLASAGRPGPVWIDIPANIQNGMIDEATLVEFSPEEIKDDYETTDKLREKVSQIVALLKTSKRPLLHVGQGVTLADATELFMKLVEDYRLPFVTARNANDIVDSSHELFAGRPGTFAQRGANFAVQNADFYLAIGTRLSLPQTGYNVGDFAKNAKRVMVDVDLSELNKKTLNMDIKVHTDAKQFLAELAKQMSGVTIQTNDWIKKCNAWKEKYPVVLSEYKYQKGSINTYYFTELLGDVLAATDVIVTDMGIAFQGTHQAFRIKKGQRLFTNCGLAAMGWGLPAAVGACVANDNKRTVCISGEGGLLMNMQELATVMHNNLPVKLFIYNNGGYMTIKQTQQLGFEGRLMGCNEESGLSFPDFMKIAEAHKIPSVRLSSHDGLREQISKIMSHDGPYICEIMMDHDQDQGPKAINKRNPDGTTKQTPLEDLYPFLDPKEVEENMIANKKE